ncbi:MAG: hypothetical protein E6J14_05220 [Chloroflexi bacterium]|nr:MAG: hypothetical protein E6J14_05220 [Chloroflexota bacterium]
MAVVGACAWLTAPSVAAASEHGQAKQVQGNSEGGKGHQNAAETRDHGNANGEDRAQGKQTHGQGNAEGEDHGKGSHAHVHGPRAAAAETEGQSPPAPLRLTAVPASIAPLAVAPGPASFAVVAPGATAAAAGSESLTATRAITAAAAGRTTPVGSSAGAGSNHNNTGPRPAETPTPSIIRPPPPLGFPSQIPPSPTGLLTAHFPLIAVLFAAAALSLAGALALVVRLAVRR